MNCDCELITFYSNFSKLRKDSDVKLVMAVDVEICRRLILNVKKTFIPDIKTRIRTVTFILMLKNVLK